MFKTTLIRLMMSVICLIIFALPGFAQQTVDTSKIEISANITARQGPLDGSSPAASFEIRNNSDKAVHLFGGDVTISVGSSLTGQMWTQTGEGDQAVWSPRVVINPPGTTGFLLPQILTIPAGEKRSLYFFVDLSELSSGRYASPITLQTLYFAGTLILPSLSSGIWDVSNTNYEFKIEEHPMETEQSGQKVVVCDFIFDNRLREQCLQQLYARIEMKNRKTSGKVLLIIDGKKYREVELRTEVMFHNLNLVLPKGEHRFRILVEADHRAGDTLRGMVWGIQTNRSTLTTMFRFHRVTCVKERRSF